MQVNKNEFTSINKFMDIFMKRQELWKHFTPEEFEKMTNAFYAMRSIIQRHEEQNRKTADYIAEKRKTNKNYARKVIKK